MYMCSHMYRHISMLRSEATSGTGPNKYLTFLNGGFLKALIDHRKVIISLNPQGVHQT